MPSRMLLVDVEGFEGFERGAGALTVVNDRAMTVP